jgi:hypothetical protein
VELLKKNGKSGAFVRAAMGFLELAPFMNMKARALDSASERAQAVFALAGQE